MKLTRLEAFLFILMRDHLPTGTICEIIENHLSDNVEFIPNFKSESLALLARDYAKEI